MYVHLDENFIKRTRDDARKTSIGAIGKEEGKSDLLWEELADTIDSIEIEDDNIGIAISNELGTFSIDIPLDSKLFKLFLTVVIKRVNKIKTMLESME